MKYRTAAIVAAALIAAAPALANDFEPAMRNYITEHVMTWISDPAVIAQVNSQNAAHAGLSQGEIDELDQAWRAQVGTGDAPMVAAVLGNDAAEFLSSQVEASGGMIAEIFVTDNLGLNVAASGATSDYWQGDEAKFTEVYGKGPDAMHVGEVEFDESAQTFLGQVSIPVTDPASGEVIGVATIGLNAEAL